MIDNHAVLSAAEDVAERGVAGAAYLPHPERARLRRYGKRVRRDDEADGLRRCRTWPLDYYEGSVGGGTTDAAAGCPA